MNSRPTVAPQGLKTNPSEQQLLALAAECKNEINPVRHNSPQAQLLKICPHYCKIDTDSLKFRLSKETQEIKLILLTGEGHKIARGDIIGFDSFQQLKISPGAQIVRHLPDGGQELVP